MSTPSTPLFQKTLVNGSQHPITKIQVWNGTTFLAELGDLTQGKVTAGIVDIDETRAVRRLLTNLLIESMGRPADQVIPALQNDLLHPASGNEIRVYRGFVYSDGTEEFVPMGVFRISKPVVNDKIGELNVTLNGNDRSAWISRIKWQSPYVIT